MPLILTILNPVVAFFFQFEGQFLATRFYDATFVQHVHKIGHNVVEQTLVMRYHDGCIFGSFQQAGVAAYAQEASI